MIATSAWTSWALSTAKRSRQDARTLYEHALQELETPEALEGLGEACWWLDDVVRVGEARERAYLLYRQRGDDLGAARVALALAEDAL